MPSVQRDVDIEAGADEVWERLVDGDWIGPGTLDAEPGGSLDLQDLESGEQRRGAVREADPGRRLSFAWWPADRAGEVSEVEIVLEPLVVGTRVIVTETVAEGLPWAMRLFSLASARLSLRV
jgi:uncharacterized protein YndB with AHSA1/START domain